MQDFEGILEPQVTEFVENHVRSLLAWDILMFFRRNPEAALESDELAGRLGRRTEEIDSEIGHLCSATVLRRHENAVLFNPAGAQRKAIDSFFEACQDRRRRLALISLVLRNIGSRS